MSEWKTIETAPKDGTWFLICKVDEGPESFEIGAYDPCMWDTYEHVEGDLYRKVPKQMGEWRGFNNFHRATHWMPLPEPPLVSFNSVKELMEDLNDD